MTSIEEETIMLKVNCKPIQAFAVQPTFCEQLYFVICAMYTLLGNPHSYHG